MAVSTRDGNEYVLDSTTGRVVCTIVHPQMPTLAATHIRANGACDLLEYAGAWRQFRADGQGGEVTRDLGKPGTLISDLDFAANAPVTAVLREAIGETEHTSGELSDPQPPAVEIRSSETGALTHYWPGRRKRTPSVVGLDTQTCVAVTASLDDAWLQVWCSGRGQVHGAAGPHLTLYPKLQYRPVGIGRVRLGVGPRRQRVRPRRAGEVQRPAAVSETRS